jgi:hypothetical protein
MLRLASRSAEPSGVWLELAFGFANLVAMNWILVRLVRQVRRLQAAGSLAMPVDGLAASARRRDE